MTTWDDAVLAARIFAVDPPGTGISLRALAGPARDAFLALLEPGARRLPLGVSDDRLLGGLDLAATLQAGRPVGQAGLLAEADGGVLLLAMAERLTAGTSGRLTLVMDAGAVAAKCHGVADMSPARFGVVALDEGMEPDERPPPALLDRLAFHLDLAGLRVADTTPSDPDPAGTAVARARLATTTADGDILLALCETAQTLGIASLRAPLLALRVACIAAALDGRSAVATDDAALAARLVYASRATTLPALTQPGAPDEPGDDEAASPEDARDQDRSRDDQPDDAPGEDAIQGPLADIMLAAAVASMPDNLLSQIKLAETTGARARSAGRAGMLAASARHGRPIGVRRGSPRAGARLHLIETLKAAAPWQRLRQATPGRIEIRPDDFRVVVFKQRTGTTTVFVVDASGSAALQRLAETKGAVELLLADCYVRRDKVALIAFRGRTAELLLPPTNSLLRAKRGLAGLPGGGGTPLAAGLDAALALADSIRRGGQTPIVTLLTDGRANVTRAGLGGRATAEAEALEAAGRIRAAGIDAILIDTSARPHPMARALADAMRARYVPLPYADAAAMSRAVRAA